jgi:hypothetical protein
MTERRCDVLVAGGGLGGVAAALAATARGLDVVMSEPTDWIGGQLTSQAVPPDEHRWIERHGCTATYRKLRDGIRAHYRALYPLTDAARLAPELNPGACTVSRLGHEPRVALAVLEAMLAPALAAGRLELLLRHAPVRAAVDGDRVEAVTLRGPEEERTVAARWFLDATETGALLPIAGTEHVTGFESARRTGEPHGPDADQPNNLQPVTVCFALDHLEGEDHTIDRPDGYERFADRFSWIAPDPRTLRPEARRLEPNPVEDPLAIGPDFDDPELDKDLWRFRRIAARGLFLPGAYRSDITLVNWPQVDYSDAPMLDGDDAGARALSLSFLYWMQTSGWPGLRLRGDIVGDTADGLAKAAYVREARRLVALRTVVEQDISLAVRGAHGALRYPDFGRHRPLPDRPAPVDRRRSVRRPRDVPVPAAARCARTSAAGEPARRRQVDRHDAHHERRLPGASGRVERRRSGRSPRRVLCRPPRAAAGGLRAAGAAGRVPARARRGRHRARVAL